MSVLVKGMGMPNHCENCPAFEEVFNEKCRITGKSVNPHWSCTLQNEVYPKPNWCPLIEVPDGHGRLIDAEYVKEHITACMQNGRPMYAPELYELLAMIDDVPTIITADKEEI